MQPQGQPPQWNTPPQAYGPPPGYVQQMRPGQVPGGWREPPWTVPGWGAIPGVIGTVLLIVGFTVLDWVPGGTFIDLVDAISRVPDAADAVGYPAFYVVAAWPLAALHVLWGLAWPLGFVRGPMSSFWLLVCRSKRVRAGRPGLVNGVLAAILAAITVFNVGSWFEVFDGKVDQLEAGAWVTLAGLVLTTAAVAIGPRVPPARKAMFGYR